MYIYIDEENEGYFGQEQVPLTDEIKDILYNYSDGQIFKVRITYVCTMSIMHISLSTLVLNSRDWSEIVWLPEISRFKINLAISFIRKNPLECIG